MAGRASYPLHAPVGHWRNRHSVPCGQCNRRSRRSSKVPCHQAPRPPIGGSQSHGPRYVIVILIVIWIISDGYFQPTRTEWDKFRRYASWMRRLNVYADFTVQEEVLHMISDNSPNGIMCPGLRELKWTGNRKPLPFPRLFLSPHLVTFSFRCVSSPLSEEILSNLASAIAELPTSSLQYLRIDGRIPKNSVSTDLGSVVSSTILRCGPSLTALYASVPLSDAAVQHIMRLPKLTSWRAMNGPPRGLDLSLSYPFPQLEILELRTEASLEWLPPPEASARRTSPGQDAHVPPHCRLGQKLTVLDFWVGAPIDVVFMSPIMEFHGLVKLILESSCSYTDGCTFGLTDDDVAGIAIALPNLVDAIFGEVCRADVCRTTVCSLLFLSIRCKNLETLEIHFNTRNLREDLELIPENSRLRGLCELPRCQLEQLTVGNAPFRIAKEDHGPVVAGFLHIFQSLGSVYGIDTGWDELSSRFENAR